LEEIFLRNKYYKINTGVYMNSKTANIINSTSLIIMGIWGFFEVSSPTAFIPSIFGVLIFICYLLSLKNQKLNIIFAHVAVLLTILILVALIGTRLPKSIDEGGWGLFRLFVMIGTCIFSIIIFIKSFIETRKNK
tara:strand:+ start:3413 stop:3817 length:405 start_codon:yes stop_codon:yes gene_type:complete